VIRKFGWNAYLALQLLGQRSIPFLPWEEIQRRQSRRVRRMVRYAYRHVPYYRETMSRVGIQPGEIQCANDLARLPLVERSELQRDPERFLSRAVDRAACLELRSSGSSGSPKTIWHDPAALFQNAAHGERERCLMLSALGRWNGYRETVIVSPINASQKSVQDFVRETGFFPGRMRVERQYLLLSDSPQENVRRIDEFRPDLLYSYGSYVGMLCAYLRQTGAAWHRPKAILYSSDHLPAAARAWLTGDCGIPVFSVYGAVEALKIGFGCDRQSGVHLNSDLYPVRILDDSGGEALPGQPGEVVLSNLVNRATVLLNYRLGDLASMAPEPCPCGRTLPLMSYPVGRVDEVIELADGSTVHPIAFRELCLRDAGILQYQVRQTAPSAFRISLVPAPDADRQQLEQAVRGRFQARFGTSVTAEVRCVEQLERTRGGKTPAVISLRRGEAC
jgi:phenylacetate-CoA ligase